MDVNKIDVLCDQVIDVALVSKEAIEVINNSQLEKYPQKFVDRINSIVNYCYTLFMDTNIRSDEQINDLMINLLNTLVKYKNSYYSMTYAYKVMNSLFDIVKNNFVEINK